jgi:trans-aconitate methyltransferase
MSSIREHDKLYLNENRKTNPKEYFKFIGNFFEKYVNSIKNPTILDIGCATGDFLYFIHQKFPSAKISGMDIRDDLLKRAKVEVPFATFFQGNIQDSKTLPKEKFDFIFMLGVHSIFDDYELILDNIIKKLKKGGRIGIFGGFNSEDVDVLVKVRGSYDEKWQSGWNMFSKKSISNYLTKKNISHNFIDWKISIDIPKNTSDPLRSWTFKDENGERIVINGTQLLHTFSLLEIIT